MDYVRRHAAGGGLPGLILLVGTTPLAAARARPVAGSPASPMDRRKPGAIRSGGSTARAGGGRIVVRHRVAAGPRRATNVALRSPNDPPRNDRLRLRTRPAMPFSLDVGHGTRRPTASRMAGPSATGGPVCLVARPTHPVSPPTANQRVFHTPDCRGSDCRGSDCRVSGRRSES